MIQGPSPNILVELISTTVAIIYLQEIEDVGVGNTVVRDGCIVDEGVSDTGVVDKADVDDTNEVVGKTFVLVEIEVNEVDSLTVLVVTGGVPELELGATNELLDFSTYTLLDVGGATELVTTGVDVLGLT